MGDIIPIVCTYAVEPTTLSNIIAAACGKSHESPESLVLLTNAANPAFDGYTFDSISRPQIDASFESPFVDWSVDKITQFLKDNATDTIVHPGLFLVADEQTCEDQSLLLVNVTDEDGEEGEDGGDIQKVTTVRVAADFANTVSVAMSMATMGANELLSLVDEDGVYRGGPNRGNPPQKGGDAPRKQL